MARRSTPVRRRALSLTSLIDVIFLLLLFFMLTTTFTRTGDLAFSVGGSGAISPDAPVFLRVDVAMVTINGAPTPLEDAAAAVAALSPSPIVLISSQPGITAQRLADVLAALRGLSGARLHVLG